MIMSNDDIKSLSFESASKELQLIINKIESGDVSLEDLSASVKRAYQFGQNRFL